MNRATKALWKRRLSYRRKRVSHWRAKGNIPKVNHWLGLVREAVRKLEPPKPAKPAHGIDVSVHNGSVDWPKVKAAGFTFAYAKCSEGEDYRDPSWTKQRVTDLRAAKIQFGPYHYLRPRAGRSGGTEARWFVKNAYAAGWGKTGDHGQDTDNRPEKIVFSALPLQSTLFGISPAMRLCKVLPDI